MTTAPLISADDAYEPCLPEIWQVRAQLTSPPKSKTGALWLIVGAALFLLTAGNQGALDLAILVVVLVIHEL